MRTLVVFMLLLTSAAWARVTTQTVVVKSAHGRCIFSVKWPRLSGGPHAARLNAMLRVSFCPTAQRLAECERGDDEAGVVYKTEVNPLVGLDNGWLFSALALELTMRMRHGEFAAAHPAKASHGITLDVRRGRALALGDLISPQARPRLQKLIVAAVHQQAPQIEDPPEHAQLDFYLTPQGIVFVNLYDAYAVAGVEAPVPYRELRGMLAPHSPLAGLVGR